MDVRTNGERPRTWLAWLIVSAIAVLVLFWFVTRDTLPREIRIATAEPGGLYFELGTALGAALEDQTGSTVQPVVTKGSLENRELLLAGKADLAILQAGAVDMEGLITLTPLCPEVIHVVARKGRGIQSIHDLQGKKIILGPSQSGMRIAAQHILDHYNVQTEDLEREAVFSSDLEADPTIDGAIVTCGVLNPALRGILRSGRFELVPILDAEALEILHPYYSTYRIPRGLYAEGPPVPEEPILTVATTAFLAARADASGLLVGETLEALYRGDLRTEFPTLISHEDATRFDVFPMHQASNSYFMPYKGMDVLASFMESLAATKELLFALGAGLYLLWRRRGYRREQQRELEVRSHKEALDVYLKKTLEVERMQKGERDPEQLQKYLDEVTSTKLRALEQLTAEELRGDRMFLIFLTQCDNLTRKIQSKLALYSRSG